MRELESFAILEARAQTFGPECERPDVYKGVRKDVNKIVKTGELLNGPA
jgi:hypothetical protein